MEIEILTKNEIILMNNPPALNYQQKEYYFNISGDLLENLQINDFPLASFGNLLIFAKISEWKDNEYG